MTCLSLSYFLDFSPIITSLSFATPIESGSRTLSTNQLSIRSLEDSALCVLDLEINTSPSKKTSAKAGPGAVH